MFKKDIFDTKISMFKEITFIGSKEIEVPTVVIHLNDNNYNSLLNLVGTHLYIPNAWYTYLNEKHNELHPSTYFYKKYEPFYNLRRLRDFPVEYKIPIDEQILINICNMSMQYKDIKELVYDRINKYLFDFN